jgi:hypothetical protein
MTTRIATDDCHLYKITDIVSGKFYIGKHRGRIQQGYWGSGMRIRRHIKKHGRQNMKYEVLIIANEQYILDLERKYVTDEFIKSNPNCLNLCKGGIGGNLGNVPWNKGIPATPEQREKLKTYRIGMPSPRKGVILTQEQKDKIKIGKANGKQPVLSEEGRKALSLRHKGVSVEKVACPHCQMIGGLGAMKRWHFDNCKSKGQ